MIALPGSSPGRPGVGVAGGGLRLLPGGLDQGGEGSGEGDYYPALWPSRGALGRRGKKKRSIVGSVGATPPKEFLRNAP